MQSPRELEYLEHQLWIPESVADGDLLENLETLLLLEQWELDFS